MPKYTPTEEHIELVRQITLDGGSLQTACAVIGIDFKVFYREFRDLCRVWRVECGRPESHEPKYVPTPAHIALAYSICLRGGTQREASRAIGISSKAFLREFRDSWREWRAELGAPRCGFKKFSLTDEQTEIARAAVLAGETSGDASKRIGVCEAIFLRELGHLYRVWRMEYRYARREQRRRRAPRLRATKPLPAPRPEDVALAEQLVAEGLTQRQIAARMGLKHSDVRFRALKPTFDRLRPERISSKVELTPEQMAIGLEMARNGATRVQVADALGRSRGSSAIARIFGTELHAGREAKRTRCLICGGINYEREPTALTCSPACDEERWSKRETARRDGLRAIEAACIELGLAPPKEPKQSTTPEDLLEYQRRQYAADSEGHREYQRAWRRAHPEAIASYRLRQNALHAKRMALKAAVNEFLSTEPGG